MPVAQSELWVGSPARIEVRNFDLAVQLLV